jgi:protein-S-isoprenylcysteine O-methyltransferase Ste14
MSSPASRSFLVFRGVVWSAGFVLTWTWLASVVRPLDARLGGPLPPWLRPPGLAIGLAGAALAGWCIATFLARGRGTPAPFDPPREFVASGPYRFVRNPMYLGGAGALLGGGLFLGSPAIALLAGAFLLLMHLVVVLYEEPGLVRRFGASYERYRRRVPRWWPRTAPEPGA